MHRGFDTLDLAIKANISQDLYARLAEAKATAEEERRDVLFKYNGVRMHLKSHGGRGYAFILSQGPHGANWSFKKPNPKDPWGIRVSIGSECLALLSLGGARDQLERTAEALGIKYGSNDISIARADVCVDILAPDFAPNPDHFVAQAAMRRRDHFEPIEKSVNGKSGRVTSVTLGKMPGRQVILYDKRAEVIARHKTYWWVIWREELARQKRQRVVPQDVRFDPKDPDSSRVWRVEMRAGKRLLKERWGIRTWLDLFDRFGDVVRQIGEMIRYCDPLGGDGNRARWPNHLLWETACAELNDDLTEMRSGVDPCAVKEVHRETHIGLISRNLLGCAITYAALKGVEIDSLPAHFKALSQELTDAAAKRPKETQKALKEASERYVFLDAKEGEFPERR